MAKMMNCPECKKEISERADTCPHCQAPVNDFEKCAMCNREFSKRKWKCPNCGAPHGSRATCPTCNKIFSSGETKCPYCGEPQRVYKEIGVTCPLCHGESYYYENGVRYSRNCSNCHGLGRVYRNEFTNQW